MAFTQSYRNTLDRDGKGKKGEKSCILPFFGFSYESDTSSYTQGVYVSDSDTLSGQRKVYRTHSLDVEVFSRNCTPEGRAKELEDRFIALAKKDDPWKMPYIPTSLREFYYDHMCTSCATVGCLVGIVLTVLWFILYRFTFPPIEAMFGYDTGCAVFVFGAPITLCVGTLIFGAIVDFIRKLTHTAPPEYWALTVAEKAVAREKYFTYMTDRYGSEAGAVLKEYAILKGYDH